VLIIPLANYPLSTINSQLFGRWVGEEFLLTPLGRVIILTPLSGLMGKTIIPLIDYHGFMIRYRKEDDTHYQTVISTRFHHILHFDHADEGLGLDCFQLP
jgi:hypothetical protein